MGDNRSLLLGFCIAFLSLEYRVVDVSKCRVFNFKPEIGLMIVIAILCIPIFDLSY